MKSARRERPSLIRMTGHPQLQQRYVVPSRSKRSMLGQCKAVSKARGRQSGSGPDHCPWLRCHWTLTGANDILVDFGSQVESVSRVEGHYERSPLGHDGLTCLVPSCSHSSATCVPRPSPNDRSPSSAGGFRADMIPFPPHLASLAPPPRLALYEHDLPHLDLHPH